MNIKFFKTFFILSFFIFAGASFAQMFGQEPDERIRYYDVQHITIAVNLDLEKKIINGWTLTKLIPFSDNFSELEFDAVGMEISSVAKILPGDTMKKDLKFDYDKQKLKIRLDKSYTVRDTLLISVKYKTADPEKGLYFIQPDSLNPNKPFQVWTQGEGEDNRYWFPCYDYPNEKASTDMFITVADTLMTVSNGLLMSRLNNGDGTSTWHWVNDKPHVSYLVMLAAGNWDLIEDSWNNIPVTSYVPSGKKDIAVKSFDETSDMLKFFSEYIGFTYPWHKYAHVVVEDFIYGGMENTSATVLVNTSVYDDNIPPDYDARGLVAHELAHQWWGDVVTCRNWNEIWLNESFATYFDALYTEHLLGKDEFDYQIMRNGDGAIWADSLVARKPIYTRDGLGVNTYSKGSVVLNMLRFVLGDEIFRKAMNSYITENQYQGVTTTDLIDAVNYAAKNPLLDHGINYRWFFDEWIYKAGQPSYNVTYEYDSANKEINMTAYQNQRFDSSSVFQTLVPVEIVTASGKLPYMIKSSEEPQTFYLKCESKPLCVIFNKGNKVLCKLDFKKSKEDWLWQLENSDDAIDRINAARGLNEFINDKKIVDRLTEVMIRDKFWGVRNEISNIIAQSNLAEIPGIFIMNYSNENDSRVKRAYLRALADYFEKNRGTENTNIILSFLSEIIKTEKRDYILAEAISSLGRVSEKNKIFDIVIPYIDMESHANVIRRTVLDLLKQSDDYRTKEVFIKYSSKRYSDRLRTNAISGLEKYLSRQEVIDYLNKSLDDHNRWFKLTVLSLLEKAGNISSIPYLEKLKEKTNDQELKSRISEVISKIQ